MTRAITTHLRSSTCSPSTIQSVQILTKCWLLTADLELLLEVLTDDIMVEDVGEEDRALFLGMSTIERNVC